MAEQKEEKIPKVFISYSWSSPEHEDWVLSLANELMQDGIDVVLDKWNLKEGQDINAFMEQMVNDPSIDKVLIVSDKTYADKANNRQGGVGTETLIITPKMYGDHKQEKFIPIIPSKDESGKACLPTYCEGRLRIDLSDENDYSANFEKLIRCIYNQPIFVKPALGKKPSYLDDTKQINIGTSGLYRRLIDIIHNGKPNLSGVLNEYLTTFSENLERFEINDWDKETFDDQIVESIELFIPARDEFLQVMVALMQYCPTQENIQKIHAFLESLFPYMDRHRVLGTGHYYNYMSDNFKFIIHELFLYIIAILIKYEKFELANYLFITQYFYNYPFSNQRLFSFDKFRPYLESLDKYRNKRLSEGRVSIHADLIEDRVTLKTIKFDDLMQADLVIFIRACQLQYNYWPVTLVFSIHDESTFEIFARACSKNYFERMKKLFDINTVEEFKAIKLKEVTYDHWPLSVSLLTDEKNLCTKP